MEANKVQQSGVRLKDKKRQPGCKTGDRIQLIEMVDDPYPIPSDSTGTVIMVTDWPFDDTTYQVVVDWDIKSSLNLIDGVDKYIVLNETVLNEPVFTGDH